jgi:hypothetical protein
MGRVGSLGDFLILEMHFKENFNNDDEKLEDLITKFPHYYHIRMLSFMEKLHCNNETKMNSVKFIFNKRLLLFSSKALFHSIFLRVNKKVKKMCTMY